MSKQRGRMGVLGNGALTLIGLLVAQSATAVPRIDDYPGIRIPPAPSCAGQLGQATQQILSDLGQALGRCGGPGMGGVGGLSGALGQVGQAIDTGKKNAADLQGKTKTDILFGAGGNGGAAASVESCGSMEVPEVSKMDCSQIKSKAAAAEIKEGLKLAESNASCMNNAINSSECALSAFENTAGALSDVAGQLCGNQVLAPYLEAAKQSVAVRQEIMDERKKQSEAVSAKLQNIQQTGALIRRKLDDLNQKAERARRDANNIRLRRAALKPTMEHFSTATVMKCMQSEVVEGLSCNNGPLLRLQDYLDECWFNRLSTKANISGEAGTDKRKRIDYSARSKAWLLNFLGRAPSASTTYPLESAKGDEQTLASIPTTGITSLAQLEREIRINAATVSGDSKIPLRGALERARRQCVNSSAVKEEIAQKRKDLGKVIIADEEAKLAFHRSFLSDIQSTQTDILTPMLGATSPIGLTECKEAKHIGTLQGCFESYENFLQQYLTGEPMLSKVSYVMQPDETLRKVESRIPNPLAAVPMHFPTNNPALGALSIPPGDPRLATCRGVDDCNAKLTNLKKFADKELFAAEEDKKKTTLMFQGVANGFKSEVTRGLSAASAQLKAALGKYGPIFEKAGLKAGISPELLEGKATLSMEGTPPTEGVPSSNQDWREIFNSGAGLLDPKSLKASGIEEQKTKVSQAQTKIQEQKNALGPKLLECQEKEAEKLAKPFDEVLGQIDSGNCMLSDTADRDYSTKFGELAQMLNNARQLPDPISERLQSIAKALNGLIDDAKGPRQASTPDRLVPDSVRCNRYVSNLYGQKGSVQSTIQRYSESSSGK